MDCKHTDPSVLGIDIGLNHTGWSAGRINEGGELVLLNCGCIHADPKLAAKYKGTLMVLKGMSMLDQIQDQLTSLTFDAVAIETPGGNTQSANAAKALGACGVLTAYICREFYGKTVLVKPSDVKKCIRPKGPVDKNEIMEYVDKKYYIPDTPRNKQGIYIKKDFEHIADSALVLEAAMKTSKLFKGLVNV